MASTYSADAGKPLHLDFNASELDIPLRNASIASLQSLEDAEDLDNIELGQHSLWSRLSMTVRKRRDRPESSEQHGLLMSPDEVKIAPSWKRWRSRKLWLRIFAVFPVLFLCFFGIIHLINVITASVNPFWDDALPSSSPPSTHDIHPIPCHSHNDYWRPAPLFDALRWGCTSVEADVWLFDHELYVGHSTHSLAETKTLRSLYIDPLVTMLDGRNGENQFSTASDVKNGVFDTAPEQTLVLLVDFKNSGPEIYPVVADQLSALREKGYLSYWDGKSTTIGPVTVVATGNAPFDLITANMTYRDMFFDAPLDRLYEDAAATPSASPSHSSSTTSSSSSSSGQGTVGTSATSTFDASNSFYASVSFKTSIGLLWSAKLSASQLQLIRGQIQGAKRRGLKARYWDTPSWPVGVRNHVWEVLVREGVDYVNGDDLRGMAGVDWGVRRHWGILG
ncbi:hypothetical protein BDV95DRAFT_627462 [Massariosphaeria phaeospora]|uniref:Altered inheritance of mitochondria protein 6 n=1 Tax=Massariosphaeria phaeospora TaxID=100035 RepID=A0A7C8I8U8_9PLEO|nr:hypothetical protein BDV95DRAFT_627462 [Massariosphaeria phaeospora]